MASQIDQLDRDALVMLYLVDELSPEERAEVDRRLAGDAELAAALAQAREALVRTTELLTGLDERQRMPVNEGVAMRRVSRSIHQWLLRRTVNPTAPAKRGLPLPWWIYPTAAAASVIVAFLVWSQRQPVGPLPADPEATRNMQLAEADGEAEALADWLEAGFEPRADAADHADDEAASPASPGPQAPDDAGAFFIPPRELWQ